MKIQNINLMPIYKKSRASPRKSRGNIAHSRPPTPPAVHSPAPKSGCLPAYADCPESRQKRPFVRMNASFLFIYA
jgi:hypothetical protein